MQNSSFADKQRFIINLGKALHQFGTPSYRLESHLQNVSELLGLRGYFLIMPTALTFVFYLPDDPQEYHHLTRVEPGGLDLGKLARTDELVGELESGARTLAQAAERLNDISNKAPAYSGFSTLMAFGCSGGAFAMLIGSSWSNVLWATLLSLVNFGLVYLAGRSKRVSNMLEPLVAIVAAILATAIAQFDPTINISIVILSAIIIFIPGLTLTVGLAELSYRHLVSGTARFMDGMMTLFKLYFGAVLGIALGALLWPKIDYIAATPVPSWTTWLAVSILSSCLVVMFKSRLKDAPWGILAGFVAYTSTLWANNYLDASLSAFVGAFAVGIYSNLFARWMKAPALIVSLQGVVLLVPGSKVYIGLNTLISGEHMVSDNGLGPQTFLIFMSLVAGLIFANVFVSANRSL